MARSSTTRTIAAAAVAWLAIGISVSCVQAADDQPTPLPFTVQLDVVRQELRPEWCWFHPRVAAVPGAGRNGCPAVVMTLQKHLFVSDYYSGLWTMRTDDLGKSWSGPTEIPNLGWVKQADGTVLAVADVTPGWHPLSGRLIAIGCSVRYNAAGRQLADVRRFSQTAYAVHDPKTGSWSKWQILEMPPDDKFNMSRCACAQWLVRPDGVLLLPLYFAERDGVPARVTVAECGFDGRRLKYLRHGDELRLDVVRGLCEPSLAAFRGRYYLTLRNDVKGYVTAGDDGLRFAAIRPWTFDDGQELGSYNTQQHWLVHADALLLAYTRRGADNDHIIRNRAPIFLAQVDPQRLCVVRRSERPIIPERGAMLGNFGAATISPDESWVTDAEYVPGGKRNARGADGSLFAARVRWSRPNALVRPDGSTAAPEKPREDGRETVLDRRVHWESDLVLEIPQTAPLCDGLPGLTRQRLDLGDVTLHVEQQGTGVPIVLLNGGPGGTHHEFHPAFSQPSSWARIIYYDQRGCGQSDYKPGKGYSIEQAVGDLHRLRQALKVQKWVVLGHSYGGALAQCYAVKHPEDLMGLVLVSSAPAAPLDLLASRQQAFLSPEEQRRIGEIQAAAQPSLAAGIGAAILRGLAPESAPSASKPRLDLAQCVYNAFLNGDWKRQRHYRPTREEIARIALYQWKHDAGLRGPISDDLARNYDLRGAFDACPIPTLLVEGVWDLSWNVDKPLEMHRMLPRATLARFERSGHLPFLDEPQAFFDLLRRFVGDLQPISEKDLSAWKASLPSGTGSAKPRR